MALNCDGSLNRDKHGFDAPVPVDHPARTNIPDNHTAGPAIGERLPDFSLPNAEGNIVEFHQYDPESVQYPYAKPDAE